MSYFCPLLILNTKSQGKKKKKLDYLCLKWYGRKAKREKAVTSKKLCLLSNCVFILGAMLFTRNITPSPEFFAVEKEIQNSQRK